MLIKQLNTSPFVSLVIPCYNERNRLSLLISGLESFDNEWKESYEIIAVDDGSQDGTAVYLRELLEQKFPNPRFKVIRLPENRGKGGALQAGVQVAKGQFILTLDADMAAHPLQLKRWLAKLGQTFSEQEILIASRNHPDSHINAKAHRKVTGSIFNQLVKAVTPIKESDTQCGFKLYPNKIGKLLFRDLQISGWAHDIEILYKAHAIGIPIKSMPITWQHVEDEKIAVFKDGLKMAVHTIRLSWQFKFNHQLKKDLQQAQAHYGKN